MTPSETVVRVAESLGYERVGTVMHRDFKGAPQEIVCIRLGAIHNIWMYRVPATIKHEYPIRRGFAADPDSEWKLGPHPCL